MRVHDLEAAGTVEPHEIAEPRPRPVVADTDHSPARELHAEGPGAEVEAEHPPATASRQVFTRPWYSPVRVSIRMRSPSAMNSGTCTVAPVDIVAVLVALLAVSPFTAGSQ